MKRRIEILPDVFLTAVQTDKFKTGCMSLNLLRPLCHEEAAANALLPNVLLRGCESCPDIRTISERLDELYGASVGGLIRKRGEVQTLGFFADFVEDELVGEPVFAPVMDFVSETLLRPVLENGCFVQNYFDGEKFNQANVIASSVNDKRTYAMKMLLKNMCADEPYGIARVGEAEELEKLDAAALYAHDRNILSTSRVELFYMGRKSAEQAADVLREALKALPRGRCVDVGTNVRSGVREVRTVKESMDVTQGKLSMGFRTGCTMRDADYPAML
ncbi:MAG: insulinase family protein, partial [Clostridia bacterium]|nr:insulinase family protein [Clostridia bacterium]